MVLTVDFDRIRDINDFYALLERKLTLPRYFGKNLDALADSISGYLAMPLTIRFINLSTERRPHFYTLIQTLITLCEEVEGFSFVVEEE